jgi:hypothetical protein
VLSGVELAATQTVGTDTIVGPRQVLCLHHLSLKAPIRLLLRAAIGGFRGIGVFHALVGRYQRPPTHIL